MSAAITSYLDCHSGLLTGVSVAILVPTPTIELDKVASSMNVNHIITSALKIIHLFSSHPTTVKPRETALYP